jgi:hypothetical protein
VLEGCAAVVGLVEHGAGGGDSLAEAVGEEGVADAGEGGRAGRIASGVVGEGMVEVEADFSAEVGTVAVVERLHDLEVLLVLVGGAGGEFVKPGSAIEFVGGAELVEGGEEVVVAAFAGGGDEVAHGEGVDGAVVVMLVSGEFRGGGVVGIAGRRLAGGRRFGGVGSGRISGSGCDEFRGGTFVAEAVGSGDGEEMFGVDGSAEVDVEVGAFGHADEEVTEGSGVAAGGAKCGFDALGGG